MYPLILAVALGRISVRPAELRTCWPQSRTDPLPKTQTPGLPGELFQRDQHDIIAVHGRRKLGSGSVWPRGQAVRQPGDFASGGSPAPGAFHRESGWSFPRMADHTPAAGYIDRMQTRLWGVIPNLLEEGTVRDLQASKRYSLRFGLTFDHRFRTAREMRIRNRANLRLSNRCEPL